MRKTLMIVAVAALFAVSALARFTVVMKDGTRYKAKAKPPVVNGRATITLENGQTFQVDANLIDFPQSEQLTRMGISDANVLNLDPNLPQTQKSPAQPSLGSKVKLKRDAVGQGSPAAAAPAPPTASSTPVVRAGSVPDRVIEKFKRAYENVGIFEQEVKPSGAGVIRADLTADSEDKVFNAISATSFLIVRNAGEQGVQLEMVELFMKTTNGGAAGRFQMTRADAEALDKRTISQQEYFVRKVLY